MLLGNLLRGVSGIGAATPENPRFNLNSPDAWDALGAERASTGQPVNAELALTWDAWYRGVSLLALYVAKTPLHVWRKVKSANDSDGRQQADDHPAYKLLRWQANEVQTAFQLQLALAGHAINRGNGYAAIWRDGPNPVELLLLDPDATYMPKEAAGKWYVTKVAGESRRLPAADVLHIRGFGFDGFSGYAAWKLAKESIGLATSMTRFKGYRYRNKAEPGVVLEAPGPLDKTTRGELREDWERMHTGLENSHRTAILSHGIKVSKLSFTPTEMQEVDQAGLTIRAAANFLGVPSSKLGDVAGIKYASKEQDDLSFLNDGLDFWFCSIEDEARCKLLLESEKDSGEYCIEFDRTTVARGDSAARANYNRTALAGQPWKTQNEVRREEGLEPVDDEGADELKTPLNMGQGGAQNQPQDVSKPGPGNPGEDSQDDPADAIDRDGLKAGAAAVIADTARRMVRRVGTHAARAAKDAKTFEAWACGLALEHGPVIREAFDPANKMLAALRPGLTFDLGAGIAARMSTELAALTESTSAAKLPAAVEALVADQEQRIPALLVKEFLP